MTRFDLADVDYEIAPCGCAEPVLHVPVVVIVAAAVLVAQATNVPIIT